jgi:hypothetical protein
MESERSAVKCDGWVTSPSTAHRAAFPLQCFPPRRSLLLEQIGQPSGCVHAISDQATPSPPADLQSTGVEEDVEAKRATTFGENSGAVHATPDLR